jgi:chemotaxis protein MotB
MNDLPDLWQEEKSENYYVSITDMLIGLLFLFIIMLMYFALQLQKTNEDLVTSDQTRKELLEKVAGYMREHNVKAEVDFSAGVLRLPNEILFERGSDAPKPAGVAALHTLSDALDTHLPCYTFQISVPRPATCKETPHHVEAIFIEGHTDSDPITPNTRQRDNWDLSSARAGNTFRILTTYKPTLLRFVPDVKAPESVFSVAGYADQRPVDRGLDVTAKEKNRRIDIRIVMAAPDVVVEAAAPAAPAASPPAAPTPAAATPPTGGG